MIVPYLVTHACRAYIEEAMRQDKRGTPNPFGDDCSMYPYLQGMGIIAGVIQSARKVMDYIKMWHIYADHQRHMEW